MKRTLAYLMLGVLAIGAIYVTVTRISPSTSAQETNGHHAADSPTSTIVPTEAAVSDHPSADAPTNVAPTSIPSTAVVAPPQSPHPNLLPTIAIAPILPTPILLPTNTIPIIVPLPAPLLAAITGTIRAPVAATLLLTLPDGKTSSVTAQVDGSFVFPNLQPGAYRLQASASGFLTSEVEFTLANGQSLTLPAAALRGGDTNRDNVIDVRDAVLVAANFGGPAQTPEVDLNRDGRVDIRDLALIGAVFGQSGPVPWG